MANRSIEVKRVFNCSQETLFEALHTPSAIRRWWQADRVIVIPHSGGLFAASWGTEDDPEYVSAGIYKQFQMPSLSVLGDLIYFAKNGPLGFEANFSITYDVSPHADGCMLTVLHDGFPESSVADEFYAGCVTGWQASLDSLQAFVEQG